jgi:hypothetical protein
LKSAKWTSRSGCWLPVVPYSYGCTTSLPCRQAWGVPSMARPRQTTTTETPTRAPRKPVGRSKGNRPVSGLQKARNGRESASKVTTAKAKPNPFDDIARQVNADLEAKDREAGRDDLTPALAKSVDQAKAKRAATEPAKPARPTKPTSPPTPAKAAKPTRPAKVQANGKPASGKSASRFKGRPTGNVQTVAERVKELGLRVRKDADIDALAVTLRATPEAVAAWLDSRRNGAPVKQPTTAKANAKPKQQPAKPPTITLGHVWGDKRPDWLYRCTLVTRYEVHPDGSVWTTLHQVLGPDGKVLEDFWKLPLDYRSQQEVQGNGRKVVLKDRTIAGLQTWLIKQGLTTPEDITV